MYVLASQFHRDINNALPLSLQPIYTAKILAFFHTETNTYLLDKIGFMPIRLHMV